MLSDSVKVPGHSRPITLITLWAWFGRVYRGFKVLLSAIFFLKGHKKRYLFYLERFSALIERAHSLVTSH